MATPTLFLLVLLLIAATAATATVTTSTPFAKRLVMKQQLKEKLTHLHFYIHDIASGPNATTVPITPPSKLNHAAVATSAFGMVTIMDDLLTSGPDAASPTVGRAQGFYAAAAQAEMGFLMAMNLAFTSGKYDGSVLTVLGRYPAFHPVREMPVVGGSGVFRLARGYALARTHALDVKTGDAVVEYNVTVVHY